MSMFASLSALTFAVSAAMSSASQPMTLADELHPQDLSALEIQPCHMAALPASDEEPDEEDFIFDPEGTERLYCMSLYSYDQSGQKFRNATSLKSQVRFAADDSTVYLRDLTPSLGAATWVRGTLDGDTIRVPYGQPLAYYRGVNLIFFCPMQYNDATGELLPQDQLKLVLRGDSLLSLQYDEPGVFQACCGYVYISESTQGFLSLDLDHQMREEKTPMIVPPSDIEPQEYVFRRLNSRDKVTMSKVNVIRREQDLYMQLSTSAPRCYVHGIIEGDSISIAGGQLLTDSTFLYYYSIADAVYRNDSLVDFTPVADGRRLAWDEATQCISSADDLFGVDYMDGGEICMDYVMHPCLTPYPGDRLQKPAAPQIVSVSLDTMFPYISFNISNVAADSSYINENLITYQLLFDDEVYTFSPDDYMNLRQEMTEVPYAFADGFDFYTYGQLHYVYLYEELFTTIGIQVLYTVDGETCCSDIAQYNRDTQEVSNITDLQSPAIEQRDSQPKAWYDLMGRRVQRPAGGIFFAR